MRKWLSFIALCCAMAMAFGVYAPSARAAALTSSVLTLKADQTNFVEKTRYRCWWRDGYRRCGYTRGWRHHRYWRHRYGWRHRYYRRHNYSYRSYSYRRHYYYNSYSRPYTYNRPYTTYRRPGYCIGLCWW